MPTYLKNVVGFKSNIKLFKKYFFIDIVAIKCKGFKQQNKRSNNLIFYVIHKAYNTFWAAVHKTLGHSHTVLYKIFEVDNFCGFCDLFLLKKNALKDWIGG